MNIAVAGSRRAETALIAVLALLLVLLAPAPAQAVEAGGATPVTAVALPVGDLDSSFTASNAHITSTRAVPNQPYWNNVAWYSWTPAETVRVFIRATSVSPQGWDNTLEVWTAGGAFVAHNDDFYGWDAALVVTLEAGVSYRIGLGGYSSSSKGSATLQFSTRTPGAPQTVTADAGNGSLLVAWTPPTDLAGGVTAYDVLCTPEGGAEFTCARRTGTPPVTSTTVTGLANGVTYSVRVAAENVIGLGEPSASVTGVPRAVSAVSISTVPAVPVSGEPFDVVVSVTASGSPASGGTVDLTVGGVVVADLPVVAGTAVVTGLNRAAGGVAVSATFSGTAAATAGSAATTVTVVRRGQTVSFPALADDLVFGDEIELTASASSGLPVTYEASGSCAVDGSLLTMTGVGVCAVTASQGGNSETVPAEAAQSVEVGKRSQTIDLGELPAVVYGQVPFAVSATSSVGLPVDLVAAGACTFTDGLLATVAAGECSVTATQAGDELTGPAEVVVRTTVVAKRTQTITMPQLGSLVFGLEPMPISATSDRGLPVTLTAVGACLVSEGVLTIVGMGDCTLTAHAAGDDLTEAVTEVLTVYVMGVASGVTTGIQAPLGALAGGASVSASGHGLLPGSSLLLVLRDAPGSTQAFALSGGPGGAQVLAAREAEQVLGSEIVQADGTAVVLASLPDLTSNSYELFAVGTALDGSHTESSLGFTIGADGTLVVVGGESLPPVPVPSDTTTPTPTPVPATAPAAEGSFPAPVLAATGADVTVLMATAVVWSMLGAALLAVRRRSARH